MSINGLFVRNFQSLRKIDLDLGTFTVIVGPSSSGKSALVRAFRALASNVRGTGVITRGQKQMAITARTDTHVITLDRGDRESSYSITGVDGSGSVFTKLGGEVPPQVTEALRLDPDRDSINFAAQFDKPYLLDESGATVARHLGELTNVNTIFEAVRQANKIRNTASSTLRTRAGDLNLIKTRLADYTELPAQLKSFAHVELLDEKRRNLAAQIGRLEAAMRTLRILERALDKPAPPRPPAVQPLNDALNRFLDLQGKVRGYQARQDSLQRAQHTSLALADTLHRMRADLTDALDQAGICPTCGQPTR